MGTFLSRTCESATLPFTPEQLGEYAEHLGVQQEQLQALLTLFSIRLEDIERVSILNPYELLEEKPPMVIIGKRVLAFHCKNSEQEATEAKILTIGTVYNPGFTPEVTTSGLALAQVASTYSESINKKEGVPPMVIRMEYGRIKDEKTAEGQNFLVAAPFTIEGKTIKVQEGGIFYVTSKGIHQVASASLELMQLPLKWIARFSDRNQAQAIQAASHQQAQWKTQALRELPSLPVPNFGEDLSVESIVEETPQKRRGIVYLQREAKDRKQELFPGHFPKYPILPLAGAAGPIIILLEKWFQELTNLRPEDFSILESGAITVEKPLSPSDILELEAELREYKGEKAAFEVQCFYFDKNGEKKKAITFEKIVIGRSDRYKQLWNSPQVAEAFAKQAEILRVPYREGHLTVMQTILEQAVTDIAKEGKKEDLAILDVGTGEVANIPLLLLRITQTLRDSIGKIHFTLSDVSSTIVEQAEQTIREFLASNSKNTELSDVISVEDIVEGIHRAVAGEIEGKVQVIPNIGQNKFRLLTGNFAFDYSENLEQELSNAFACLKEGGKIIAGFIRKYPPYYALSSEVIPELEKNKWKDYDKALVMSDIGRLLARFSILGGSRFAHYRDPEEIIQLLEKVGFHIEAVQTNTFGEVGFIVQAKRP